MASRAVVLENMALLSALARPASAQCWAGLATSAPALVGGVLPQLSSEASAPALARAFTTPAVPAATPKAGLPCQLNFTRGFAYGVRSWFSEIAKGTFGPIPGIPGPEPFFLWSLSQLPPDWPNDCTTSRFLAFSALCSAGLACFLLVLEAACVIVSFPRCIIPAFTLQSRTSP